MVGTCSIYHQRIPGPKKGAHLQKDILDATGPERLLALVAEAKAKGEGWLREWG